MTYIRAEIYRICKTKVYVNFIKLMAIIIGLSSIYTVIDSDTASYLEDMMVFFKLIILIMSIASMVVIYKKKDTKIELISMGISRSKIFIKDLLSLQIIMALSVVFLGLIVLLFNIIANLIINKGLGNGYNEYFIFMGKLIFLMINVNNGLLGLSYLFNNVALGATVSFIAIPSILQIIMFETEGRIHDLMEKILLIQPFELLDKGLDTVGVFDGYFPTIIVSFAIAFLFYLLTGYVRFMRKEIR